MKPQVQLVKAAQSARHEIGTFLACCSNKEIRDSYRGFDRVYERLVRAIARYYKDGVRYYKP